jgi:lipopolysaccharide/colanic/teichoic acid biosynthesis glycosyltransferase
MPIITAVIALTMPPGQPGVLVIAIGIAFGHDAPALHDQNRAGFAGNPV